VSLLWRLTALSTRDQVTWDRRSSVPSTKVIFVRSATGGSARRIAASKTLVASLPLANPYAHTLGGSPWLNENETSCVVDSSATRWVDEGQAVLDDGRVL